MTVLRDDVFFHELQILMIKHFDYMHEINACTQVVPNDFFYKYILLHKT